MKSSIKLYGPALALAIIGALAMLKPAQAHPQRGDDQHFTVVLSGTDYNGGLIVDVASSSAGAPQFQRGDDLAQVLELLRSQGAVLTVHSWGYLTYTATK